MITDAYLPLVTDTSNPWISLFKGIHDQYISGLPWDGNVLYGMAQAYTLVQVLKAAGRNPTRAGVVKTLETTKLTGGPGLAPYGYASSNHLGSLGVQVTTVGADGSLATVGPVYTSTDAGPITQYAGTPYEVTLPRVPWLREQNYCNAQTLQPVAWVEFQRKLGQFDVHALREIRSALSLWLGI